MSDIRLPYCPGCSAVIDSDNFKIEGDKNIAHCPKCSFKGELIYLILRDCELMGNKHEWKSYGNMNYCSKCDQWEVIKKKWIKG